MTESQPSASHQEVAIFTGKTDTYQTGAVREEQGDRPRVELISPEFILRIGAIASFGARKYAPRNWEQGIPLGRLLASTYRHLLKFHMGLTDEDHIAMAGWNIQAIVHTQKLIELGLVPATLDDLPHYATTTPEAFHKLVSEK